ncbi:MAG: response regulator transcription factor [Pseudomonadota bacterium]
MRLLVLEDDETLGPWLVKGLQEAGHVVDLFKSGRDALVAGTITDYDALILDRMTPELDGLSVLKALRAAQVTAPAIFLTAMDDVEDRVEGLEAGGNDYLIKPFAFSELLARIMVMARNQSQSANPSPSSLTVGDISIDLHKRTCSRAGQPIDLNTREFQLLEVFMRNKGRVLSRTMLLERVWDMNFDPTTSVVETHISRLRAKVERPFNSPVIRTIRGAGYVFDN